MQHAKSFGIASLAIGLVAAAESDPRATAAPFTDHLVQAPRLAPPERGSVAGALANLEFEPGSLSRGDFALPIPIALPSARGAPLTSVLPSYSPEGGQTEWGIGWRVVLSIQRTAIVGDIDLNGDEFVSPWGRLVQGSDGRYRPLGQPAQITLRRVDGGWQGITGDGTTFTFAVSDSVASGYAWMLTRVDSVVGERTILSYERNASGRPFVTAVEWGGRGDQRQYRADFVYEALAVSLDDYRSGTRLTLDRRIREVRVAARSATSNQFEVGWIYQLDYMASPHGAAFYLTGVTKIYRSGLREPTQRYDYDFGSATLAAAALVDVPALDAVLAGNGNNALQPDKATVFDVEDDGEIDFEIAKDQTLVHQRGGAFSIEPLPDNPARNALCRPTVSELNRPRRLVQMTPDAGEPQVIRTLADPVTGTTRILICNREGVLQSAHEVAGGWGLGPNIQLVDLNHDQRPDFVRVFSQGYQVVENTSGADGHSFVRHPSGALAETFTPTSTWVHDMNGDGQADLVTRFSNGVKVWHGLGNFRFTHSGQLIQFKSASGDTLTDIAQRQLTFVDVNRDGLMDVLSTRNRSLSLFINNGRQLSQVIVPAMIGLGWEFGAPVIADVTGTGNFAVMLVQSLRAKALQLTTAATGLMVAAHDGKGTDISFGYKRGPAVAGIGRRSVVLDTLTVASSGYDTVTYSYGYAEPILHTAGKHLIGFAGVDKQSPLLHRHAEFFHDDDVVGVPSLLEDVDSATPGIIRFTRHTYDDAELHGMRWLRPASVETGHRTDDASTTLSTTTQYAQYEREFCPTVTTTSSPDGQLTTITALASVAAIADELHCLPASQVLVGVHSDLARNFSYLANLTRNDVGQITRVTQTDPEGHTLVLQDATYGHDHRITSLGAPGRGITTVGYDAVGRIASVTDPFGVVTISKELDPVSDDVLALETARPGAAVTTVFQYDGRERLQATWDNVSGGSPSQPLTSYDYQDATSTAPARIDTQTLADAATSTSRHAVALLGADGNSLLEGTWLGTHFSLGTSSITDRNTRTQRSAFVGTLTDQALSALTSAELRELGTPLAEAAHAGFGHAVAATTTYQANVTGTVTTELVLGATELVTRVHQPGGFTAESAVNAAGRLVRNTDETGVIHRYGFDVLGRLVRIDTPDGAHTLTFDGFGRPARIRRAGIGEITYAYDPDTGLLARKQHRDPAGTVIDTSDTLYDAVGRPSFVTQVSSADSTTLTFDYDGQLDGTTVPGQLGHQTRVSGDGWQRSALYDPLGRSFHERLTLTGWRELTSDKTYRADGSVASDTLTITDPSGAVRLSSTKETELDGLGRIAALKVNGAVLYTLQYDGEGRLARADFTSGESITFDHDPVTHRPRGHQVESPAASGGVHWEHDARGLIAAETYTHDTNQIRRNYTYDGRGALLSAASASDVATYSYTASGLPDTISDTTGARSVRRTSNQLTVGGITYSWDSAGRVVGKGDWTFDYGGNGQLARASRPSRQIDFIYDDQDQRLLKRVDGIPVRANVANGVLTEDHFVELVTIGGVVAGVLDNGQFTALLTDPRGTPFAGPDGAPGLASPYGVRTSHLGLAEVIDFTRLGWDPDLDVVRMGVRDYDAKLSQFLTPDPLYFENLDKCQASPLECALYGYAAGNPISLVDPSGRDAFAWAIGIGPAHAAVEAGLSRKVSSFTEVTQSAQRITDGIDAVTNPARWAERAEASFQAAIAAAQKGDQAGVLLHTRDAEVFAQTSAALLYVAARGVRASIGGDNVRGADLNAAGKGYVNLANAKRTTHILFGDATGGGHKFGLARLFNGKSKFPITWSRDKIMHAASDVATSPASTWVQQTGAAGAKFTKGGAPVRWKVDGMFEGIHIRVVVQGNDIVTAFPVK